MKKAQSISINTIIVALIALVVMVVLIALLSGKIKLFSTTTSNCAAMGGVCDKSTTSSCNGGYIKHPTATSCDKGYWCCIPISEENK
jgi:hypothetical protein